MSSVGEIAAALEILAPLTAAEDWDNVGLLVGDRARHVARLMTCLTITPSTAAEAVAERAEMIVVHHPLPFRPAAKITTEDTVGRLLWNLIGAGISIYSAHTAYDSAIDGINEQWAKRLDLSEVKSLLPAHANGAANVAGSGRFGELREQLTIGELMDRIKAEFGLDRLRFVGDSKRSLRRVAVACGSGGTFLDAARATDCDCLVTGEATFHTCLAAEALDMGVVLCGHFASERFAMESLAAAIASKFTDVNVWASRCEHSPIHEW